MSGCLCSQQDSGGNVSTVAMSSHFVPMIKDLLRKSVDALPTSLPFMDEDESMLAALIFESMYTPGRVYHSMQHVFNITENCDIETNPILILSTLFHDVVYYSVDKAFTQLQSELLEGVLEFELSDKQEKITLQPLQLTRNVQDDVLMDMVVKLFDLKAGMELPKLGTNEFLSAIIGIRVLSKWLHLPELTQVAAAIEATIPFRPPSSDGKTAMDRLYDRLINVAPNQEEDWLEETIHLSARMANCDLCSFDSSNFDFFLDSTWSLIPEFRPALLNEDCSLREYRDELFALEGRTKFLASSVPNIFQVFRNVPSQSDLANMQAKTHSNLQLADEYARVRMLQLMVLVEFVAILGEDPDSVPGRPFLSLQMPESLTGSKDGDEISRLLALGRRECFPWDPSKSSLGAFLYNNLGKDGVEEAIRIGKNDTEGNHKLLGYLPLEVLATIATHLGTILPKHSEMLLRVPDKLGLDPPTCVSTDQ